jgi:hypothetical protein
LVEVAVRQMQRQHRRERRAIVGDKQAPALFDLERDAGAQLRHQALVRISAMWRIGVAGVVINRALMA